VIALAALVGDQLCDADPTETIAVNLKSTGLLANAASTAGVQRVVFASSCSVYGASGHEFVDESTTPAPVSLYAETRLLSEEMLFKRYQEIGPVALRLSTVFGLSPRMRFDLVVNAMTARAVTEAKILVFNADHWRPFVHVHDAARAFIRALDAPGHLVNGQRFNVGADYLNCTIGALATVVARRVTGATIVTHAQNGDRRSYRVRFDHIRGVLSYEPHRLLEEGIAEVANALTSGTIADHRHPIYYNALYRDAVRQSAGTDGGRF
jgi:nucleoside-diphosphate-sugar epimerase